jgi:large subunit ribosomal protein L21
MESFAVIKTGGKQYVVRPGDKVRIERLEGEAGASIVFDEVLLTANGDDVQVGTPNVSGASVTGEVVRQARERKKIIFKYHSKTRHHRTKGHRQHFTEVEIKKI